MAMAAKPVSTMKVFLSSYFMTMALLYLTTTIAAANTRTTKPQRFVTKLIHRDSIFSPYYNPNATIADRAREIQERSIARLGYLARTSSITTNDARAHIIAADIGNIFLVKLSIGEPPVEQLLAMDTGSNLLWVQCLPCIRSCFRQYSPYFDPLNSHTYKNLTCGSSPYCSKCDPLNHCEFSIGYAGNTSISGILGTEKISGFFTADEGAISIPDTVFGCAHDSQREGGELSGILGLGPSNTFVATKMGNKFSYCIGNILEPKYPHNLLVLGDGAIIQGSSTPLEVFSNHYYLTMESISVGQKVLNIDPKVFQRDPSTGKGGVVIDSGATLSYLAEGAFHPLSDEVKSLLDGKLQHVDDPDNPSNLCYKGDINRDLTEFPVVTFRFAGGAELKLDTESFFIWFNLDQFCMAVRLTRPSLNDINLVGAMAQQHHNVGYDIDGKKLTIEGIDCQLLDS